MIAFEVSTTIPLVTITWVESEWDYETYCHTMASIKHLIAEADARNDPVRLFVVGSVVGGRPPLRVYNWILKDVLSIVHCFKGGVQRTAIFKPTNGLNFFFKLLKKCYKPQNPFEIFAHYHDAEQWVRQESPDRLGS
jgi:hypothetical protein